MQLERDFEQIHGVWAPRGGSRAFNYSDGASTEAALLELLRRSTDLTSLSDELRRRIVDWPTRYHLSPERSNLMRCLDLDRASNVMELGAGCGAVTRYLGERVREVVAMEGSLARAQICRERCRGLNNVRVVAADAFSVEPEARFDVVTLIGVLEYAGLYDRQSDDPWRRLLEQAGRWLRPGGQLLLAIENQFGIKYFAGCREDHGLPRFSGIEGYPEATGVRTFGRQALTRLLHAVGFGEVELLLPFPDYKIPNTIVNARYTGAEEAVRYGLADWCRRPFSDYVRARDYLFDDHLALAELADNGLLADMANSFLFVATLGDGSPPTARPDWIARRYSIHRHPEYQAQTVLTPTAGGAEVRKQRVDSQHPSRVETGWLRQDLEVREAYVQGGQTMALKMLRALRRQSEAETHFAELLLAWLNFFDASHMHEGHGNLVRGEFVDCIPDNLVTTSDGGWRFIDREWTCTSPVSLDWLFYRGLRSFWFHHCIAIAGVGARKSDGWARFVLRAFELLGSPIGEKEWSEVQRMEARLQHAVQAGPTAPPNPQAIPAPLPLPSGGWPIPGRLSVVSGKELRLQS